MQGNATSVWTDRFVFNKNDHKCSDIFVSDNYARTWWWLFQRSGVPLNSIYTLLFDSNKLKLILSWFLNPLLQST
jgi:hypothetical protein